MPHAPPNIRSKARAHTESAINTLVGIMNQEKAPHSARVRAASAILDRGWGKPTQVISGDDERPPITVIERVVIDGRPADTDG